MLRITYSAYYKRKAFSAVKLFPYIAKRELDASKLLFKSEAAQSDT